MKAHITGDRQRLCIALEGELDHHGAQQMTRRIVQEIDARLPQQVQLNLQGVSFMDSSGIAVILRTQRHLQRSGGRLSVSAIPPQARKVLDTAGIGRFVTLEERGKNDAKEK